MLPNEIITTPGSDLLNIYVASSSLFYLVKRLSQWFHTQKLLTCCFRNPRKSPWASHTCSQCLAASDHATGRTPEASLSKRDAKATWLSQKKGVSYLQTVSVSPPKKKINLGTFVDKKCQKNNCSVKWFSCLFGRCYESYESFDDCRSFVN